MTNALFILMGCGFAAGVVVGWIVCEWVHQDLL